MATAVPSNNTYGEVHSKTGLRNIFVKIRHDVAGAESRKGLTELYRRAGYLIALTHSSAWRNKFGRQTTALREIGVEEFARTARKINRRAQQLGTKADYDETWGG